MELTVYEEEVKVEFLNTSPGDLSDTRCVSTKHITELKILDYDTANTATTASKKAFVTYALAYAKSLIMLKYLGTGYPSVPEILLDGPPSCFLKTPFNRKDYK